MARRVSAKVKMNRAAIGEVYLAVGDGILAMAQRIVEVANVPDATPLGRGLIQGGDAAAWVDTKKIGGGATKPPGLKLAKAGVTAVAGFGFPARFVETGTVNMRAEPFLTPAVAEVAPDADVILGVAIKRRLRFGAVGLAGRGAG